MPQLGLKRSREDCAKLKLRARRNHDARRTMISIARAGGASKDLLEWVTHGPPGDVIDGYTTLPWETLCQQVECIKIERREGKLIELPRTAAVGSGAASEASISGPRSQVRSQVPLSARADSGNGVGRTGFGPDEADWRKHGLDAALLLNPTILRRQRLVRGLRSVPF
jgi:hypothetical protein